MVDITVWWAPGIAFAAGVVAFASPCVLPLVPGYLGFVTGVREADGRRPVAPILLFVLGFSIIFSALGAFSSVFGRILRSEWGLRTAGIIVIFVGLFMIAYAFKLGTTTLFSEKRPLMSKVRPGRAGAVPLGMAFAAGWTPCIGPFLAATLGLAAAQGGGAWGALLLFSFSLGLGVPLLALGLGMDRLMGAFSWVKRNYRWFGAVGGVFMVGIGVLLALNLWNLFLAEIGLLNLIQGFEPPI